MINLANNRCIRYRNGRDYIQEEIVPMAAKEILNRINSEQGASAEDYWVLANLYSRVNLSDFKLDTVQKSIEKVRYILSKSTDPSSAVKMSKAYQLMMQVFFHKK